MMTKILAVLEVVIIDFLNPSHFSTVLSSGIFNFSYKLLLPALSFSRISFAYNATCLACCLGTTMTPSPSATTTSPGLIKTPPTETGLLTDSISFLPRANPTASIHHIQINGYFLFDDLIRISNPSIGNDPSRSPTIPVQRII